MISLQNQIISDSFVFICWWFLLMMKDNYSDELTLSDVYIEMSRSCSYYISYQKDITRMSLNGIFPSVRN